MIFVDHSRDDAFSADRSQVGHVPDGLRFHVWGPLLPGLVRPVAVVTAPRGAALCRPRSGQGLEEMSLDPMPNLAPKG
jgi:hypothetical protein